MSGAVDINECPHRKHLRITRGGIRPGNCRCGRCAVCGYQKHEGIHGPLVGQPPGSKPWGHEFVPERAREEA